MKLDRFLSLFRHVLSNEPSEIKFLVDGAQARLKLVTYDVESNTWKIELTETNP